MHERACVLLKRMEMKSVTDTSMSGIAKLYRGITHPIRLLPDFLIIGTQRGGTTSLYNYLIARPGVGPATVKELHFFDKKFTRGPSWYRAHFPTSLQKYGYEFMHKQAFV